ncbi:MAG: DUF4397 domain-containing protein [Acidobacteriota bacterium]
MKSKTALLSALAVLLTTVFTGTAVASPAPLNAVISVDGGSPGAGMVRVRVVHASPDAPNVDVRVDGGLAFENIPFEQVTDYAMLPAGTYQVQVEPAGANNAGPFVIDANLTLTAGTDYTVVASDLLANITPLVLVDDNAAPAAGEAKVRFLHGSADAPAVDIALANGGAVLFPNISFQEASDYISVPANTYDLEVRVAGTQTVVLTLPGIMLNADTIYTAYATGLVADGAADRTLYVANDQIRVEVDWTDFENRSGFGRAVGRTAESGFFWFFDDDNIELVIKSLDGCSENGFFWFFYGALSNVEYDIRVTYTATGENRVYRNEARNFGSFGDTTAFACAN